MREFDCTMDLQHVNVKIYVDGGLAVDPERFIEVFHGWIQEKSLPEMLIDVADYRHVPAGPGVLLIASEADYSLDNANNRYGLRYNRKASIPGSNTDRFRQAFRSALTACQLLERHFSGTDKLKFSRREFDLFINDRALAPNTAETWACCQPELHAFFESAFGCDAFTMQHNDDLRSRFGVSVTLARPFDLDAVLSGFSQ